jgi:phosphoribosylformylglycinamidine cyclo-ligase
VFDWLQREGNVAHGEMWRTFNCGIGYVLIVAPEAADAAAAALLAAGTQLCRPDDVERLYLASAASR